MPNKQYWTNRHKKQGIRTVGRQGASDEQFKKQTELYCGAIAAEIRKFMDESGEIVCPRILDYGAGYGRLYNYLKQNGISSMYTGVDIADVCVEHLRSSGLSSYSTEEFASITPEVHIVVTCTVLQHIIEDEVVHGLVNKFSDCIKPGGMFICLENTNDSLDKKHIKFRTSDDYLGFMDRFTSAKVVRHIIDMGERHTLFVGVR